MSNSSSSNSGGDSRHQSESRQSSEEIAQELFANIEQFTKQAKKAAESIESAVEASKSKVKLKGKVGKDTLEDMDMVRKNVVDDFKTAFKSLGDSNEVEKEKDESTAQEKTETVATSKSVTSSSVDNSSTTTNIAKENHKPERGSKQIFPQEVISDQDQDSLASGPTSGSSINYEIFNNLDMYTLASQTQDFFGGLLGRLMIDMILKFLFYSKHLACVNEVLGQDVIVLYDFKINMFSFSFFKYSFYVSIKSILPRG